MDAASLHHNPGQLGYLERPELSFGAGLIVGALSYQRNRRGQYQYQDNLEFARPIAPQNIDPSKTGNAAAVRSTPVGPTGDAFFAIPVIRNRWVMGVGVYVPYAAVLSLPENGAQRFAAQDVLLASAALTVGTGIRLHDVISIGAGISYVPSVLQFSRVQDFASLDVFAEGLAGDPINQPNDFGSDAPAQVRELDVMARQVEITRAISHGVTFNAGVALQPTEKLSLAVAYQHGSRVRYRGDFTLNMDDDFFTQDLAAQGLQFPPLVSGEARVEFSLPKRVTLGAAYQLVDRFRLELMAQYVSYQDVKAFEIEFESPDLAQPELGIGTVVRQDIPRNWLPVGIVEFKGLGRVTDKLSMTGLLGYQSPASPDATIDMASPDGHRFVFGAGIGYAVTERFAVLADFEGQLIAPRTVTDSDYDLANGRYTMFLANMGLHGQVRFGRSANRRQRKSPAGQETSKQPGEP